MSSRKCSLRVVTPSGKHLQGTAAILHATSRDGGYDAHLQKFAAQVVRNFIEEQQKPTLQLVKSAG